MASYEHPRRKRASVLKLSIKVPPSYPRERAYIIDVLFGAFLGLDYRIEIQDRANTEISLDDAKRITLPDVLFQVPEENWLRPESLPVQPLPVWDAGSVAGSCAVTSAKIPIIYGYPPETSSVMPQGYEPGNVELPIDILGSAFFMLTRYEELVKPERDAYGRFPLKAALAFQEGFLGRPIVNEYLEILWCSMAGLWPGLRRKERMYRFFLSHDVDIPLISTKSTWMQSLKGCGGDIIKRGSLSLAGKRIFSRFERMYGSYDHDPFDTFDYIMDVSEKYGIQSAFNFICGVDDDVIKERYDIHSSWIRNLLSSIHARGHEIGLHPSLGTYRNGEKTRAEFSNLLSICNELKIHQDQWGGRQHRLQWENPTTWRIWDSLQLDYDSTLTFAEQPGFRCGVCYEYPVFDLVRRERLKIKERPLIVMEGSLFTYMKVDFQKATEIIRSLHQRCKAMKGDFVFLCHNSKLISYRQKRWYAELIDAIH